MPRRGRPDRPRAARHPRRGPPRAAGDDAPPWRRPPGHVRGHPLYYYVGEHRAGAILRQDVFEFGGTWLVVSPAGESDPLIVTTDNDLYVRGAATLLASWEQYARGSAGAALQRLEGVAAAVFPTDPERGVYNNALLDRDLGPAERISKFPDAQLRI